jgi:hypothetical protein
MMGIDIVVTIPKPEYENDDKETQDMLEKDLVQFWTLSKVPRKLRIGDRVYFVKNGKIESSMRVVDIIENSTMTCETTKRTWSGKCQIIMDDLRMEQLDIQVKGFQGFRYRWW